MALATYTKSCSKNVAGNGLFYLTEASNINTVTISAGEVTALTLYTAKAFSVIDNDLDSLIRSQEGTGSGDKFSYMHKIEAKFSKLSTALNTLRNAIADASPCGMVAMVKDGNGTWWLVGYNAVDGVERALKAKTDSDTSGNAPDDEAGGMATITLECKSGYLDLPIKSTSTVTTAGVTAGT
jgi:hypothetical protein